jgi:sugar phosphate isomerase/epimerase
MGHKTEENTMQRVATHPRVSIGAASSYRWALEEDIAFYQMIGVTAAGLSLAKFPFGGDDGVQKIKNSGLRISSVVGVGSRDWLTPASSKDGVSTLERLRPSIDLAAEISCSTCYFVAELATPRLPADEAFESLLNALKPAISYARGKGVVLAVEHASRSIVHTLADAAELARVLDIGICLELYNCWVERRLSQLFAENVSRFRVVQVSDCVTGEMTPRNRLVPGDGDIPLEWMIGKLLEAGYDGFFEIETIGPKIEEEGYADSIRRGVSWLSERLARWGA